MYLTAGEFMDRFDAVELAQIAPPASMARVTPPVMRAVILGEDTSAFPADEVDAAAAGVQRLEEALADAGQVLDGWLAKRHTLPIDPVPGLLKRLAGNIARFHLHDDRATEEIRKRYEDSIKTLEAISAGKMTLGLDDPSPASSAGPVTSKTRKDRVFTDRTLADFGHGH